MKNRSTLYFAILAVATAFLVAGFAIFLGRNEYRDRIACEHFKAEGVLVQAGDGQFFVYYPDGRRVTVSGTCVAEYGVMPEKGPATARVAETPASHNARLDRLEGK